MAKQVVVLFCLLAYFEFVQLKATHKTVEQIFKESKIVPDVIPKAPKNFLKVSFGDNLKVDKGNELTPTQVKSQPKVEWTAKPGEFYTLILSDPDAPSRSDPKFGQFRHWLVTNIPGNDIDKGDVIAAYVGAGAPKDTGFHRYVFLLYKQPGKLNFEETRIPKHSRRNRRNFKAAKYAEKYNLGSPVAGNFYIAQYDDYVPFVHGGFTEF